MSTIKLLLRSASCFARTSLSPNHRIITACCPAGSGRLNSTFSLGHNQHTLTYPRKCDSYFLNGKSPTAFLQLTKHSSNSYSTKAPIEAESKKSEPHDPKAPIDSANVDELIFGPSSNLTQFQKFKLMYKKYWYVLIPVHIATSLGWVCGFYYLSKSGVDIPAALKFIHISETIIEKVKHSDMGHYAIAYLCYKVVTPIRYGVSLGMTTLSIKRLVVAGFIKPIPTKKEFIAMYEKKKALRMKLKENENNNPCK